jgi:mono/diheme cytochrome c family protein
MPVPRLMGVLAARRALLRRLLPLLAAGGLVWPLGGAVLSQAAPLAQQEPPRTGGAYWAGRYGCTACHGARGEGTPIGPPLTGRPDSPLSYEVYLHQVRTPLLLMPDYPPEVLPDERVLAIAEYFWSQEPAR